MKKDKFLTYALIALTVYFCSLYLKAYYNFGLKIDWTWLNITAVFIAGLAASLVTISVILSGQSKAAGTVFAVCDFLIGVVLLLHENMGASLYIKAGAILFCFITSAGLFFIAEIYVKRNSEKGQLAADLDKAKEDLARIKEELATALNKANNKELELASTRAELETSKKELSSKFSKYSETKEELEKDLGLAQDKNKELEINIQELEQQLGQSKEEQHVLSSYLFKNVPPFSTERNFKQSLAALVNRGEGSELADKKPALLLLCKEAEKHGYKLNGTVAKVQSI